MSNAKGSGKDNKLTQPAKVVAQARSETNAISSQDLRQRAQKAVAMPAAAVRAAMASAAKNAVPSVRVAYDVLSRLLSFVETGHAVDHTFLKAIKRGIDTAHAGDAITKRTIGKAFADIARLNEVVTRVVSYKRTYADIARSTDLPAKSLTKAPRVDTARSTDVRVKTIGKNKSDTITLPETFSRIVSFKRSPAEIINSSDVKKFTVSKPKADIARGTDTKASTLGKPKADTLSLAELKKLNLGKVAADISRASDSDKLTFTKRINDFVSAIHAAHVQYGFTNSEVNLSTVSDTLTKLLSWVRVFQDTARLTETTKRVISKPKAENPVAADRLTRVVSFHKVFADSEHTADVLTRIVSFNRSFTEIPRATDARAKTLTKAPFVDTSRAAETSKRTMTKAKADTARSSDSFSKLTQYNRAFSSTITSTHSVDVFSSVRQYNRTFLQTARTADTFTKVTIFRRLPADIARASETLKRVTSKPKVDTSRATDLFLKTVSYKRTKADTSRATDVFTKVMFRPRAVVDVSRATDLITAKYITKRLNSIVQATGLLIISGYNHPGSLPPRDIGNIRENFQKLVSFIRTFNDTVALAETKSKILTTSVGTRYSVWSDFNELIVDNDTTQTLASSRTEILSPLDSVGKKYSKVANKIATYYYNAYPVTDFAELTFARTQTTSETTSNTVEYSAGANINWTWLGQNGVVRVAVRNNSLYPALYAWLATVAPDGYYYADFNLSQINPTVLNSAAVSSADSLECLKFDNYYLGTGSQPQPANVTRAINVFIPAFYAALNAGTFDSDGSASQLVKTRTGPPYIVTTSTTVTTPAVFDQDQLFTYTDSYQADTERALVSDAVTRVVQAVRTYTDVARANETVGRTLQRTVGDVKSRVFNDVADLFYTQEFNLTDATIGGISQSGGRDAVFSLYNTYPNWNIVITNGGSGYWTSSSRTLTIFTPDGDQINFRPNGGGAITSIDQVVGSPRRIPDQTAYFTDFDGLTFGKSAIGQYGYTIDLDQDLVQRSAQTFKYPGGNGTYRVESTSGWSNPANGFGGSIWQRYEEIYPTGTNTPYVVNVGPTSAEASAKVLGQEMLYTLTDRADGDTVKYADSSSKQITKQARRYLPNGIVDDYADLTFGTMYDQELTQFLTTSWPESVSLVDTTSRVTLGPTKRNRDTAAVADAKSSSLSKPKADTAAVYQTFVKTYNMSAGAWASRTWRDYNEISGFAFSPLAEMSLDYEGRYELIMIPDTLTKVTTKPLHFETYVWRDYNELTFGTPNDQEVVLSWYNDSPTDIVRTADDARRVISPAKADTAKAQETFGKEISINALGDYRSSAFFRDFLGIIPSGETGPNGDPIMDEDLVFKLRPGDRTDRYDAVDSNKKTISKTIFRTVDPYWSDYNELTFGTIYDQELVQYQPTTRDDSATSADLYKKVSTFIRAFNDVVRANDTLLLSKNGLAYSTYVLNSLVQSTKSQDQTGRQLVKAVGDYKSQTSIWQDFVELEINLELAQFYYRGPDSTLDISRTMDRTANVFNKKAGRVQNIMNVNTFDVDVFYDIDLQQLFPQDYVTEIIYTTDQPLLTYSKNKNEIIKPIEFIGKNISKGGVGDTIVDDWNSYSPLYLNYLSDLEDSLQKQYPPHRIDVVRSADTVGNYYRKQAGFDPINKWYTNFEYLSNDETILTEGVIENRDNTFPQQKFTKYLDEIVYEYTEEQMWNPFRTENLYLADILTRVMSAKRTYPEITKANDQPSIQFSPATKAEVQKATDVRTKQYTKTGGANLYTIWSDYLELDVANQDLTQAYDPYRIEYLRTIDAYVAKFTKGKADAVRTTETFVRTIQPNKSEIIKPIELVGKFTNKPQVGDSTLTAWYDSYEILSYDPTLLTYGEIRTTRFDIGRAQDAVGKNYNVSPGDFKSRTWFDFNEIDVPTGLTQYWTPYSFEPARAFDSATRNLNKGLKEIPKAKDSGSVRVFSSNAYVRDTSPYYAEDYTIEGVTTVTF